MTWTALTARQGGLVSRRQLLAAGLTRGSVDALVRGDRLVTTRARGVYRAAGAPQTYDSRIWAAVLASDSPLSYLSAAQRWGAEVPDDGLIHITRFDRRRLRWPPGVRVHRVALSPDVVTRRAGMAMTTRTETLLDCLGWLSLGRARVLADRAVQQSWIVPDDLARRLEAQPHRWGNRQLRVLLHSLGDGAAAESERRMHRVLREAGIGGWVANLSVAIGAAKFEIDVAFPERRLAIEIDGYRYHSADGRFQRDRTKQNALVAAGWRVLRFTWADIEDRPAAVVERIYSVLAA